MNKRGMYTSQREDTGEKVSHQIVAVSTQNLLTNPVYCLHNVHTFVCMRTL